MKEDDWDPYVCNLPEAESCNEAGLTPDFWPDHLIEELEVPSFIKEIKSRKNIVKIVAEKNGVDENVLRWATWMIRSRRFSTWDTVDDPSNDGGSFVDKLIPKKVEQVKGFLLPLIDMANHALKPNAAMQITVNKWTRKFDDSASFVLQALSPISKDEEITISYGEGDWTCLEMMDKYGFFLENGEADKKFDWKGLNCSFSTSMEEDENERTKLLNEEEKKREHGSRVDLLTLRIYLKRLISQ
jgi:hypothetical protein